MLLGLWLKAEDRKKNYGLELAQYKEVAKLRRINEAEGLPCNARQALLLPEAGVRGKSQPRDPESAYHFVQLGDALHISSHEKRLRSSMQFSSGSVRSYPRRTSVRWHRPRPSAVGSQTYPHPTVGHDLGQSPDFR